MGSSPLPSPGHQSQTRSFDSKTTPESLDSFHSCADGMLPALCEDLQANFKFNNTIQAFQATAYSKFIVAILAILIYSRHNKYCIELGLAGILSVRPKLSTEFLELGIPRLSGYADHISRTRKSISKISSSIFEAMTMLGNVGCPPFTFNKTADFELQPISDERFGRILDRAEYFVQYMVFPQPSFWYYRFPLPSQDVPSSDAFSLDDSETELDGTSSSGTSTPRTLDDLRNERYTILQQELLSPNASLRAEIEQDETFLERWDIPSMDEHTGFFYERHQQLDE